MKRKAVKFDYWDAVFIAFFCAILYLIVGCAYHGRGDIDFGYQYNSRDSGPAVSVPYGNQTPENGTPFEVKGSGTERVQHGAHCESVATFRYDPASNRIIHYRRSRDMAENNTIIISENSRLLLRLCGRENIFIRAVQFKPGTGLYNSNRDTDYASGRTIGPGSRRTVPGRNRGSG